MNYLKIEECKHGFLYSVLARNFAYGVFNADENTFLGIRYKFGDEYLFPEYHWDADPNYGTVKPLKELEQCPFANIDMDNEKLFDWLKKRKEDDDKENHI